jgi:hypothetical protein
MQNVTVILAYLTHLGTIKQESKGVHIFSFFLL